MKIEGTLVDRGTDIVSRPKRQVPARQAKTFAAARIHNLYRKLPSYLSIVTSPNQQPQQTATTTKQLHTLQAHTQPYLMQ